MLSRDAMFRFSVRCKQALVGKNVQAPREAFRRFGNEFERARVERVWSFVSCLAHAKHQVLANIGMYQRFEAKAVGDALTQGTQEWAGKLLVQFLLAEQGNLQQLVAV